MRKHQLTHPGPPRWPQANASCGQRCGTMTTESALRCVIGYCLCINTLWVACFRANCSFRAALQVGYSSDVLAFAGSLLFPNLWKGNPHFDASTFCVGAVFLIQTPRCETVCVLHALRWAVHRWLCRNLVDPASSHMLVSKIKPCMSQYKLLYGETANGSLKQL